MLKTHALAILRPSRRLFLPRGFASLFRLVSDVPPRCAFGSSIPVAAAPSGKLLAALRRGASVSLASTHPAPRLERTWRELEDLRDPANWPDDSRQRRRVRGAMRRVCDDRATRAHLDASWELVAAEGGWQDEL